MVNQTRNRSKLKTQIRLSTQISPRQVFSAVPFTCSIQTRVYQTKNRSKLRKETDCLSLWRKKHVTNRKEHKRWETESAIGIGRLLFKVKGIENVGILTPGVVNPKGFDNGHQTEFFCGCEWSIFGKLWGRVGPFAASTKTLLEFSCRERGWRRILRLENYSWWLICVALSSAVHGCIFGNIIEWFRSTVK